MTRLRTFLVTASALVAAATLALLGAPASQASLTTGMKAIASSDASGVAGQHTGFGPGWVSLTFDTGGTPHGPVIGYLFHDGVAGAVGNDHFDVSTIFTGNAASVTTPFAGGYAYGHFNGCAWSYLDDGGDELYDDGSSNGGCTPPNHTAAIFCYDHAADGLCSDGSGDGEGEPGVWRNPAAHTASINPGGCDVYGNIGASAIYDGGAGAPANLIAHVDSGSVQVRYVDKADDFVMANLTTGALPGYIQWGFYPRACLS